MYVHIFSYFIGEILPFVLLKYIIIYSLNKERVYFPSFQIKKKKSKIQKKLI